MAAGTNLIGTWTTAGTAAITINSTTKAVTINNTDGTGSSVRQQIATEIGKRYSMTWDLTTSTQMWRNIGTTSGAGDIIGDNVSTVSESKISFTATTTSVWVQFYRIPTGTATVSSIRFEENPTSIPAARRLNARNQRFTIDAAAAGLRTANTLHYIGGWFKFQYLPTATVYLMDFAVPDAVATGGLQRARIFYDPANAKLGVSNADASKYQERYASTTGIAADQWHYGGIIIKSDGDVSSVYDQTIGGTTGTNTGIPGSGNFLSTLMFGARTGTTPTNHAPIIMADWVWCAGFVPTNAQITALAQGYHPADVADFSPTYYWPMTGTAATEDSTTGTATLTALTAPANVTGPDYIVPLPAEILPLMMF